MHNAVNSRLEPEPEQVIDDLREQVLVLQQREKNLLEQLAFLQDAMVVDQDALTGLPNREMFKDRLITAIARAKRDQNKVAVVALELDNFRTITESLGHDAGDELIKQAADRLADVIREVDTLARLDGGEFALVLPDIHQAANVKTVIDKLMGRFLAPMVIFDAEIYVTASLGITLAPDDDVDPDELLRHADTALRNARNKGGDGYQFFESRMNSEIKDRVRLDNALRRALKEKQFVLYYQPIVDIVENRVSSVEALIRWLHPEDGLVPPGKFIPYAEESGLINSIGDWAMGEACRQIAIWHHGGSWPTARVAVNLSARQFQGGACVEAVTDWATQTCINPESLTVEITENLMMDSTDSVKNAIDRMKERGLKVSMDDFGTGYSSLSYLKKFNIDVLKIDRSFVSGVTTDDADAALVKAIFAMSKALGVTPLAEGVETIGQLDFLRDQGCRYIQGFYFSKPIPADDIPQAVHRIQSDLATG